MKTNDAPIQGTHETTCAKAHDHARACDCRLAANYRQVDATPSKICYENEPYPTSGWLVVCLVIGKFVVVHHGNFKNLGNVIGSIQDEADKKYPDSHNPVQCFELGREMAVGIDYAIVRMQPAEKRA